MANAVEVELDAGLAETIKGLMRSMEEHKVFILKVGDVHIEMSQYAFAPKPSPVTAQPAQEEEVDPALTAFNPAEIARQMMARGKGEEQPKEVPKAYQDPTDPNAPINDEELFGTSLPQPS